MTTEVLYAHKHRRGPAGGFWFGPRESVEGPWQDRLDTLIDQALVTRRKAEYEAGRGSGEGAVARKRIGAGYIGMECGRALAFRYHKQAKEERGGPVSPGQLQRHAEAGHWTEEQTATWLRWAGFTLTTEREDGQQHGFKAAPDPESGQYRLAGEVDGVILEVPAPLAGDLPTPCIWESKKATAKKFRRFAAQGVAKADPKYFGQVQACMFYMGIGHVLFSMLDLDSMAYYWELIPFDPDHAERLVERAVRVLESEHPEELPRITRDPGDHRCKFCDFRDRCWSQPATAGVPAKPAWL